MAVNAAIIGYGNQAKRLENIFSSNNIVLRSVYHPTKIFDKSGITNNLEDLYENDCIFITSPNKTHFGYIQTLMNDFSGYVFCEKPPVTSKDEVIFLQNLPKKKKQKIFFNFNFRFSSLSSIIESHLHSEIIGKPIHLNFISTHGLAFKKEYLSSWRSNSKNNVNNILDTVAIHFIDLLIFHLGIPNSHTFSLNQITKTGTSKDSAHISLVFSNGITASIFVSYASSYINEFSLIGTNGFMTLRENTLKIFHPRNSFSPDGSFVSPPIFKKEHFDMNENYKNSLSNSLKYFLNHVQNKTNIPLEYFNSSLQSNQLILEYDY